jgi:hypothetical protein
VLKYSEILSQLESARQDAAQVSRALDASRAETQAAKVSTDAVAADKARTEDKLSQHLEEHVKLDQVILINQKLHRCLMHHACLRLCVCVLIALGVVRCGCIAQKW